VGKLLHPGTYVVAVSGGVDSMVLLDLLHDHPELKLVVAHYDHGIRPDSDQDRKLVQEAAKKYNLKFVYDKGKLGSKASEAKARRARYEFLHKVRMASNAKAVVTAHHQDDLLETAILNILRGTGRKGITSLRSTDIIKRPLLNIPKKELLKYAKDKQLIWREDDTNQDTRYKRNYVRHKIISNFSESDKKALFELIRKTHDANHDIDEHLTTHLHVQPALNQLDRHYFIMLPHIVAREVMLAWLRRHDVKDVTSRTLERLVAAAKTFKPGQQTDVDKRFIMAVGKKSLALHTLDR
jgi:tRNA(Ile)-lysidine synthetase-like protein